MGKKSTKLTYLCMSVESAFVWWCCKENVLAILYWLVYTDWAPPNTVNM